jgi:lambda family phage portal protein
MMTRTADESGAVLVRRMRQSSGRIPLKLQVLEPDYLDTNKYGLTAIGTYIVAGIEINRQGQRVAYWLYDQHPGESTFLPRGLQSKRIDASEIIHFYEKERPGQLHGISRLASAMLRMRDHDDWRDAVIVKKKIEACFAAFVVGGGASTPLGEASTEVGADGTDTDRRLEQLSPGMIEYLPNGGDVKFANPSSGVDGSFSKDELHAIAVGCGITYEQLTGDLSGVNFSSMRGGLQDFRAMVDAWRWIYFMPMAMRPIQKWFLDAAWTGGAIRSPEYAFTWTPPAWPYVNPTDDIAAIKEAVRGGLCSLSEAIRGRGDDPVAVFEEIERERKSLAEKGVVVDTDAGTTPKTGGATSAPAAPAASPAEDAADGEDAEDAEDATDTATQAMESIATDVRALLARGPAPIHVDASSVINVPPSEIRQDINVAPAAAPEVRVEVAAPNVEVNAPVNVRAYPASTEENVERDASGEIVRVTRIAKD